MAGKRHKKALRQLSEQEVAKSSVLEITESQNFPRPPDVDRLELYDEQSRIQETCEDADLLIVGLDYVREIRGYEDTKYFCDLCSAQCVANSIIKHLIGFKHQMNCLKKYCCRSYNWVKDLDKRDRRVDRELKVQLEEAKRLHGKGRIRVFEDVKRNQRSPELYNPYRPSTSRPALLPGDVQGKKTDELTVTDEDCLSRDFSDFYCKVCDSHMNNYSMWESHARGKRHSKNKKKAPIGLVTNSNFIEAPHGTISHLEAMIYEQCGPNDIIVGLNFIRENQGENGDLYNCYLCGSVCPTIDIIDHLYLKKHKTKYLEKMLSDGYLNAINEISCLPIGETAREGLIDAECEKLIIEFGRGRPVICVTKNTFFRPPVLQNHKAKDPVGVGSFKNRKPPHVSGLDYIRETRGYVDKEYYYDPYNAQCAANSIIKNFLGFNHQLNNLKKYCQGSHRWVKDCDERDKRLERELKFRLEESKWLHGNGKRRVFKDVQNFQKSSEPYNSYQPSISRQNLDIQNRKKAPKGLVTNINFTEAPPSKLSHLEEMIRNQCGPDDIIVGLNFLRENPGVNGHLYDCNLCGGVYHSMDILSHLSLKKHRTKYLEKMHSDGCHNAINEINGKCILMVVIML
ncbi:hypothetical protein AVEN_215767-1 [Araneus ventricosus]|uniref:Matrin-type domain-containing protein n=1 Tax=Araneus ventricosus TaxID=182803 RepID=A0A4Y2JL01_ARAVE|nr:hypothetical protein AVEN_215767-1 [Araneus ventricosus]